MSWPRILAYYAVAILLALHLQSELRRSHPETEVPVATTLPFVEAVPERIDRLRAETDDLAIEFQRRDGRWVVTEPVGVVSPSDIVDAVIESLTTIPPVEIVADGAEHGQYGLNPPRVRVRMESAGEVLATIAFGERNPTRTAVYAKKAGKEEVYLLGLNAQYYLDLIFENVRRQQASGGVPTAPSGLGSLGRQPGDAPYADDAEDADDAPVPPPPVEEAAPPPAPAALAPSRPSSHAQPIRPAKPSAAPARKATAPKHK